MVTAKESIIKAFLQLIDKKSLQEISVKEIVRKADISRSTFYLHFIDKYDLMEHVRKTLNDQFLSFYKKDSFLKERPVTPFYICDHIFKYRSFYQVEFNDANEVMKLSNKLASHLLTVYDDQDYAIFASYGTIGYLSLWVRDGFVISPDEVAEKLLKIGFTDWTGDLKMRLEHDDIM